MPDDATILNAIRNAISDEVDAEYTRYKEKCLDELGRALDLRRNAVVKSVLDSIEFILDKEQLETNIVIKVIAKKENKRNETNL